MTNKKILTVIIILITLISCNSNKKEMLKANLIFDGTCCTGELILYDNYNYEINYSTSEDGRNETNKGTFSIENDMIILNNDFTSSGELLVTSIGDLFTNKYKLEGDMLIPSNQYPYDLNISFINRHFFKNHNE